MSPEYEYEIIKDCQNGTMERFGELYDEYLDKIYRFVYYRTLHKQTAEDITQETFFKAMRNMSAVDPSKKFSSWLYKIAYNTVIDSYRAKKVTVNIDELVNLADDTDIARDIDRREAFKKVLHDLENLSDAQRDIVVMRIWDEMSYREIADVIGKDEGNCKVIFSRALTKLREVAPQAMAVMCIILLNKVIKL
jgi:RNA polymerase sigma-70 factor (ECF subfamily)